MRKWSLAIFLILANLANGQESTLDRDEWKKVVRKLEYKKSGESNQVNNEPVTEGRERSQSESFMITISPTLQIVVIILFIVILTVILLNLLRAEGDGSRNSIIRTIDPAEQDFEDLLGHSDLEKWLHDALQSQNYRLAIRIYFLMALKNLEEMRLIKWEKKKTNWHYILELRNSPYQISFQALVHEYDQIWYGEKDFLEEVILQKLEGFRDFNDQLKGQN